MATGIPTDLCPELDATDTFALPSPIGSLSTRTLWNSAIATVAFVSPSRPRCGCTAAKVEKFCGENVPLVKESHLRSPTQGCSAPHLPMSGSTRCSRPDWTKMMGVELTDREDGWASPDDDPRRSSSSEGLYMAYN
ncbi:unnamed protein product, partial [Mycena citricolor]